jgi:aminoglycoside phosphotransferase family enzyme/predicted kinase
MESRQSHSRLIEAMMRADFYPEKPSRVEFKQTHMSYVFLAGDYVYKVKKPVRFAFADAFTLGTRYFLCREEVRLNRRLAPEVYLGVIPIVDEGKRYALGAAEDLYHQRVLEYAVKMRRLPRNRMLDHLLQTGELGPDAVPAIAAKMAAFHAKASSACGWRYGSAVAVQRAVLGSLEESRAHIGYTIEASEFDALSRYLSGFINSHRQLVDDRAHEGRVRDGHGDLRCEHVCMDASIDIFDCLEFDEALRYCDVASEMAFLAMDLEAHGAPQLADQLVGDYARLAGDRDLATLINFYKCHRACIRGKVDTLKSLESDVPAAERQLARERARAKFSLALTYAHRGRPTLLVVCGLVGTGKSTVAEMLRRLTGFEVFNSDRIRKALAGVPDREHRKHDYGSGIYGAAFDRLTYYTMLADARKSLGEGRGAILDATFKNSAHRRAALALSDQLRVPFLFVECKADEQEVLRRLSERSAQGTGVSDATPEVYRHQLLEYAPIREIPARYHVVFEPVADGGSAIQRLERALARSFESETAGAGHGLNA